MCRKIQLFSAVLIALGLGILLGSLFGTQVFLLMISIFLLILGVVLFHKVP